MIDPKTGIDADGMGKYGHDIGSIVSIGQQEYPPFWKIVAWEKSPEGFDVAVMVSTRDVDKPDARKRRENAYRLFLP